MTNIGFNCPLCVEFEGDENSVFHQLLTEDLQSRIIRKTDKFLVFPPLGQFVEGSLLFATKDHIISFAHIPDEYYEELEMFLSEILHMVSKHYKNPIVFEHGPMTSSNKGTCCVDHAHFNIFPVDIDIHRYLKDKFPFRKIKNFKELQDQKEKNKPYLFVQDNNGNRYIYDVEVVPSQYIRQIIAKELGMPEKWHWREYIGEKEFMDTIKTYGVKV